MLALALPAPVHAGGVVAACDEAHLLAALAGGGAVTFACSGVITLTNTITITTDTTIDGSGQEVTISGNDAVRVFHITEGVTVSLNAPTVADGRNVDYPGGGGIYNLGTLSVNNSTFAGNSAYQGGGIANRGTLIVSNSAFSGNHARYGAGLCSDTGDLPWPLKVVEVSNRTFVRTSAKAGGGVYSNGAGINMSKCWLPLMLTSN